MAKVTLTFEDKPGKSMALGVVIESDPPFPGPAAKSQKLTMAQTAALTAIEAISKTCKTKGVEHADARS